MLEGLSLSSRTSDYYGAFDSAGGAGVGVAGTASGGVGAGAAGAMAEGSAGGGVVVPSVWGREIIAATAMRPTRITIRIVMFERMEFPPLRYVLILAQTKSPAIADGANRIVRGK